MSAPATGRRSLLDRDLRGASLAIWAIVGLAAFEGLAVAAALPDVAGDLGRVALLPWVITTYLLTSGVATVVAGPLVDSLGVRWVFRIGVVLFTAAGTLAAFVPSMELLVAVRVLQGAGAGLVSAVALSAVALVYPPHLVGRAFAANSNVWGVMGVAGPGLAALLLTVASWRWIFGINLPLGLLALVLGWNAFPGPVTADTSRHLDLRGTVMVLVFTSAMLLAVDQLSPWSLALLALATVTAIGYRAHARRSAEPVLAWRHVARAPHGLLGLSVAALLVAAIASNTYLPLYVRAGRGAGPTLTAWSILFFVLGWTTGANTSSRLLDRLREITVVTRGHLAATVGISTAATLAFLDAPLPLLFAAFFVGGAGTGATTNAALTLLRSVTPDHEIGRATAAHQYVRNQGFSVGAAMGGAVLLFVVGAAIGDIELVRELLAGAREGAGPGSDAELTGRIAAAVADGFAASVAIGAGIAVAGLVPLRRLRAWIDDQDAAGERSSRPVPPNPDNVGVA